MKVEDVVMSDKWHLYPWLVNKINITVKVPLPSSKLIGCIGKPIVEVIKGHPGIDSRYGPHDVIEEAYLGDDKNSSVFRISHKLEIEHKISIALCDNS